MKRDIEFPGRFTMDPGAAAVARGRPGKSCCSQTGSLLGKNFAIQRRKPALTAAEYLIVPLYLLITYWLMFAIFPDKRITAADLAATETALNAAIPSSCTFLAMDSVG